MPDTPKPGTPLPWKRESYYIVGEVPNGRPGGEVIVQCSATVSRLRDAITGERNAAYIVHACNRLPELEADLLELRICIDTLSQRCGFPIVENLPQVLVTIGNKVDRLEKKLAELEKPCVWKYADVEDDWHPGCRPKRLHEWPGIESTFCPYCGHPITEESEA